MPLFSRSNPVARLPTRKLSTQLARVPARRKPRLKKTAAEVKKTLARQKEHRTSYNDALSAALQVLLAEAVKLHAMFGGHTVQWYLHAILQHHRTATSSRAVNRWNAYVRQETAKQNAELAVGLKRRTAAQVGKELKPTWLAWDPETRIKNSASAVAELTLHREMKDLSVRNAPIAAFHDARANLDNIQRDLDTLHARTGTETILIAVRGQMDHFSTPRVYGSSIKAQLFYKWSLGQELVDIGTKFEAYCISGVQGVAITHIRKLLDKKALTAKLILEKLRLATGMAVPRMYYLNFDRHITALYRVVVQSWPLTSFTSPSSVQSMNEIDVLYNAWKSGATTFRVLSAADFKVWEEERILSIIEEEEEEESLNEDLADGPQATAGDPPSALSPNSPTVTASPSLPATTATTNASSKKRKRASEPEVAAPKKKKKKPLSDSVNTTPQTITGPAGVEIEGRTKAHKTRCDKGKPRGPQKKTLEKRAAAAAAALVSATVPAASVSS